MSLPVDFRYTELTESELALREEVRAFLAAELPPQSRARAHPFNEKNAEFTAKMATKGWVGMALPKEYGGHSRTAVERFIVVEEMLAAGAPVGAHWVADRQSGPSILRFGSEEQKQRFLPGIARGEIWFSIGMSEPDAGSDLAAVATRAQKVEGGWVLNGTKIWTSGAHENHWFIVLCRTAPFEGDKHNGLSQLLVDLRSEGLKVNPIRFLDGTHHFNEVVMTDVFVPDENLLGEAGMGWHQVNNELSFERAGPERFLFSYLVFENWLRELARAPTRPETEMIGRLGAKYSTLRQLSLTVSRAIDEGRAPAVEAALLKDVGTVFSQQVTDAVRAICDLEPSLDTASAAEFQLAQVTLIGPSFTIAGGSSEVLRTVAARGLQRR
ncbi:MAG: acyl-CoA dehydrogenase family protein [Acidimicrobiales bacterium]